MFKTLSKVIRAKVIGDEVVRAKVIEETTKNIPEIQIAIGFKQR